MLIVRIGRAGVGPPGKPGSMGDESSNPGSIWSGERSTCDAVGGDRTAHHAGRVKRGRTALVRGDLQEMLENENAARAFPCGVCVEWTEPGLNRRPKDFQALAVL